MIHIGNIYYITHTHHKKPIIKIITYYTWNNSTLILLHGDIELNPGPLSTILKNLPKEYTQRVYIIITMIILSCTFTHLTILTPHTTSLKAFYGYHTYHPYHKATTTLPYNHPNHTYNTHNTTQPIPLNQPTLQTPIIIFITHISTIRHTTHTHLKHPKTKVTHYYTRNNSIIILLGGDIHTNPGLLFHTLNTLPHAHTQRQKQSLMINTIMFKKLYKLLKEKFKLYPNTTFQTHTHHQIPPPYTRTNINQSCKNPTKNHN